MAEGRSSPAPRPPEAPPVEEIARRLADVEARVRAAGGGEGVTIVGVTKTFPLSFVERALAAGLTDIGESYAQELEEKAADAAAAGLEPRWHFIGGLQRNKVKRLAGRVWLWQSVDREVLVDEIAKRDPGARILVQVNTTGEAQKSGCDPGEAGSLIDRARAQGLQPLGLMTLGPTGPGGTGGGDPRRAFDLLRELAEACEVEELSMGMSGDYEQAVAAGATMIRIGTSIFGPRSPRS